MPTRVFCNFTAADATSLNSLTPGDANFVSFMGTGWASAGIAVADTEGGGTVSSNQAAFANAGGGHVIDAGVPDVTVEVDFIPGATNDNRGHVILRYQQDGDLLFWNLRETEGDVTLYSKVANGASTSIATTTHTFTEGSTYALKAELYGQSIKLYIDSTLKIDTTSALHTTQTKFGLAIGGGTNTNLRFDNFRITSRGQILRGDALRSLTFGRIL